MGSNMQIGLEKMFRAGYTNYFKGLLWAGLAALLFFGGVKTAWAVNAWSLAYLGQRIGEGKTETALPEPPEEHANARVWLAGEALEAGNAEQAYELALPSAGQGNLFALSVLGESLAMQGEFDEAVQAWLQAGNYERLLQEAREKRAQSRIEEALLAYSAARDLNPILLTIETAEFLRIEVNDPASAIALLQQALLQYPTAGERGIWLRLLGEAYRQSGNWTEAETAFQQYLKEQPENATVCIGLGWVYYHRGDGFELAKDQFEKAIALEPQKEHGYLAMGRLFTNERQYREADAWYRQAIERNPNAVGPWLERGNAAFLDGNLSLALQIYRTTTQQFPSSAGAYYELAQIYKLTNLHQEALTAIKTAISLMQPPSIWYYLRAGEISESANVFDEAEWFYKQALVIDPNNQAAQQGLERIQSNKAP